MLLIVSAGKREPLNCPSGISYITAGAMPASVEALRDTREILRNAQAFTRSVSRAVATATPGQPALVVGGPWKKKIFCAAGAELGWHRGEAYRTAELFRH